MVARTSRWLFLSLALILILYIRDLLGQTKHGAKVVEGLYVDVYTSRVCACVCVCVCECGSLGYLTAQS